MIGLKVDKFDNTNILQNIIKKIEFDININSINLEKFNNLTFN